MGFGRKKGSNYGDFSVIIFVLAHVPHLSFLPKAKKKSEFTFIIYEYEN